MCVLRRRRKAVPVVNLVGMEEEEAIGEHTGDGMGVCAAKLK